MFDHPRTDGYFERVALVPKDFSDTGGRGRRGSTPGRVVFPAATPGRVMFPAARPPCSPAGVWLEFLG